MPAGALQLPPMPSAPAETRTATLLDRLREHISRDGPMPVDRFMSLCLADPEHGYWQRAATIGADGDFTTAPEISQVFGELIGVWCGLAWQGMGRPAALRLVELGPGRGTLMRDALRAATAVPGFLDAVSVDLIEASAPLRALQRQALLAFPTREKGSAQRGPSVTWHDSLEQVPPGPAIVVGNEFLDALPIRQLIRADKAWRERVVALDHDGGLRWAAGPEVSHSGHGQPATGDMVELRSAEEGLLAALAARPAPVMALFIDYGPAAPASGDTLQAVRRHAFVDPLAAPGMADLTAHVHFGGLAEKARAAGLAADGPLTQAEFLGRMGAAERAARLMAANPARAGEIEAAVQRLMSPTGMGQLFKALAVRSPALPVPMPFG